MMKNNYRKKKFIKMNNINILEYKPMKIFLIILI